MKYIVEVKYTNPAHEHVSLRRRVDTINRVVEARNEDEAINRVARQQRALGFLVREAKVLEEAVSFGRSGGVMHYDPKTEKSEKPAKGISALDKDGNLVGHYPDLETAKKLKPGHTYKTNKGVVEEVELDEAKQVDHAKTIAKSLAATHPNFRVSSYDGDYGRAHVVHHKSDTRNFKNGEELMGPNIQLQHNHETNKVHMEMQGDFDNVPDRDEETHHPDKAHEAAHKMFKPAIDLIHKTDKTTTNEEVEQTDEALLPKQQAVADKLKASELAANKEKAGYKFGKSLRAAKVAAKMQKEETEVQYIEEKLTAADPASEWIKDFVASDNPKFAGKSKKERIQMALGAYYAAKKSKNEEAGEKYNEKEVKHAEKKQDKKKGSLNKINVEPEMEPGKPNA